jgi:hypothetical protein
MYQRVLVLNFPKIALEAPPLACALLCEICNKNKVDYDFIDCNAEFILKLRLEKNSINCLKNNNLLIIGF